MSAKISQYVVVLCAGQMTATVVLLPPDITRKSVQLFILVIESHERIQVRPEKCSESDSKDF
jgi:hypothetical protein